MRRVTILAVSPTSPLPSSRRRPIEKLVHVFLQIRTHSGVALRSADSPLCSGSSFGPTSAPVVKIGGAMAVVQFAGLVAPGEFQFNVVVPTSVPNGDNPITATYNGTATQSAAVITIQN